MSTQLQSLFNPVQLTAAAVTYFTAQANTRIDKLTVTNTDTVVRTVTINWVPSGGAVGVGNEIVVTRPLQPNEAWDVWPFIGHTLLPGDFISALASAAAKVNFFGSGTVMTG